MPAEVYDEVAWPAVGAGRILVTLSSGALLARPDLIARAKQTGGRIIVPSGGILGLDALKAAAEGEIHSVTLDRRPLCQGAQGHTLDRKLTATYVGRYLLPHHDVTVTRAGGHLYIDVPAGERSELFAEAPSQFFLNIRPWTLTFVKEGSKVARLDILGSAEVMSGRRVD